MTHEPTPHEPIEGVTLWNSEQGANGSTDAAVHVDGRFVGCVDGRGEILELCSGNFYSSLRTPRANQNPLHDPAKLAAFRDSIRESRRAKGERPEPAIVTHREAYTLATWPVEAMFVRGPCWTPGERSLIQYVGIDGIVCRIGHGNGSIQRVTFAEMIASRWQWSSNGHTWCSCDPHPAP